MNSKTNEILRIITAVFIVFFIGIPAPAIHAQVGSVQSQIPGVSVEAKKGDAAQSVGDLSQKKDSLADHKAMIFEAKGEVRVLKSGQADWIKAETGMWLEAGDQILTGEKSHIEFAYDDFFLNIARIEQKTKAEFRAIEPTDLYMEDGTIFNALDGLSGSKYQISTPTAVAAVRGTEFIAMENVFATNNEGDQASHAVDVNGTIVPEGMQFDAGSGLLQEVTPEIQQLMSQGLESLTENIDPSLQQQGLEVLGIETPEQNQNLEGDKPAEDQAPKEEGDENKALGGNPPNDGSGGDQGGDSQGDLGEGGPLAQSNEGPGEAPIDSNEGQNLPAEGEAPIDDQATTPSEQPVGDVAPQGEPNPEAMVDAVIDSALAPPPVLQGEEGQNIPGANIEKEGEGEGEQGQKPQGQGQEGEGQNLPENFQPGQGPGPFPGGEGNLTPGPQFDMSHMDMNSLGQFMMLGGAMENFDPNMIGPTGPEMMTHDFGAVFTNLFEGFQGPEGFSPGQFQNFTEGMTQVFEGFTQNFQEGGNMPAFFGGDAFAAMDFGTAPAGFSPETMNFFANYGEHMNESGGLPMPGFEGFTSPDAAIYNPESFSNTFVDSAFYGIDPSMITQTIAQEYLNYNNFDQNITPQMALTFLDLVRESLNNFFGSAQASQVDGNGGSFSFQFLADLYNSSGGLGHDGSVDTHIHTDVTYTGYGYDASNVNAYTLPDHNHGDPENPTPIYVANVQV